MLKLNLPKEPYWLDLPASVRVKVRPLTTALMSAAQSAVIKDISALRAERKQRLEAGMDVAGLPDVEDERSRAGLAESLLIKALAIAAILEWQGVMVPEGESAASVTDQTVSDLMDIWFVAQDFWKQYTRPLDLLVTEGNSSRPAAPGTSAAGRDIAGDAPTPDSPAAGEKRMKPVKSAPTSDTNR